MKKKKPTKFFRLLLLIRMRLSLMKKTTTDGTSDSDASSKDSVEDFEL